MPSNRKTQYLQVIGLFLVSCVAMMLLNALTQPAEEKLQMIQRGISYWKDWIWYVDDIVGPGWFVGGALYFYLVQVAPKKRWGETWPLALLALTYIAFGLVDTVDAHWVPAAQTEGYKDLTNLTSNLGKVSFSIVVVFSALYAAPWLSGRARRAVFFVAFLLVIDLHTLSIWLDFAGLPFHIFEECMEVVAGAYFALVASVVPIRDALAPD